MNEPNIMVLIDTDKIKEYVFATNRLSEIRGASAILDSLNLKSTYELLNKISQKGNSNLNQKGEWEINEKTIKENNLDWEIIFLGGGSGKIFFTDEKYAKQFCHNIQEEYWNKTDNSASITTAIVTKRNSECFQQWVSRGERLLRKQKDSKPIHIQPLTSQYFKSCQSSGIHPAEEIGEGDKILIAKSIALKRDKVKINRSYFFQFAKWLTEQHNWSKWSEIIGKENSQIEEYLPNDLNDIGYPSNNYIGFIYADANRMGQRLSDLTEPKDYKELSKNVSHAIKDALFSALDKHTELIDNDENKRYIPFEVILIGGDDLMVVVPANKAIEITIDFCDKFKEKSNISICAGVVITHSNYPIHRMMDHAQGLLHSAKALSNKKSIKDCEINAIDYMVLKGSVLQEIKDTREREFSYKSDDGKELRLYQRPYTTDQLGKLLDQIRRFKENDFPTNKLRTMYESLYRGKQQAMLDYLFIASRLSKSASNKIPPREIFLNFGCEWKCGSKIFPWWKSDDGSFDTPFIDMIELYDFVD
jgi:cellobiose-specific phosphotransferase system component IIA